MDPFRAAAPPIREPPVYTDNVSTHRELTYPYGTACRKTAFRAVRLSERLPLPTPEPEDRRGIRPVRPLRSGLSGAPPHGIP